MKRLGMLIYREFSSFECRGVIGVFVGDLVIVYRDGEDVMFRNRGEIVKDGKFFFELNSSDFFKRNLVILKLFKGILCYM